MSDEVSNPVPAKGKRRGMWLGLLVAGMLGFAFLNVPLFRVFCEHYGLFVNANEALPATAGGANISRSINILFTGITAQGLNISFQPVDSMQTVHPGQRYVNHFTFTNNSNQTVRFRAIHDIFPADAAVHTALIQCFCFNDQTMAPHTSKTLPVIYQINRGLDPLVARISLMYTLEPLAPGAPPAANGGSE
jgi:cytochrome c oxidase assembly protein subunit 11